MELLMALRQRKNGVGRSCREQNDQLCRQTTDDRTSPTSSREGERATTKNGGRHLPVWTVRSRSALSVVFERCPRPVRGVALDCCRGSNRRLLLVSLSRPLTLSLVVRDQRKQQNATGWWRGLIELYVRELSPSRGFRDPAKH